MEMSLNEAALTLRLAAAQGAARAAGDALLVHYAARERLAVEQKGVNDFVSNADREAERIISDVIQAQFPEDGFLGEETGLSGDPASQSVWCVDPLDGTTNFLKGAHNWCVSIGLWSDGAPRLGVIYDPLRGEMFSAASGQGTRVNGKVVTVSDVEDLDRASIGLGHNRRVEAGLFAADVGALLSTGAGFRQVGAGALMLAYVAAGRVDSYFERHMWAWDAMAGLSLILEAGGAVRPYATERSQLEQGGLVLTGGAPLVEALDRQVGLTGMSTRP